MYSVLFSNISLGIDLVCEKLKKLITPDSKVLILPWAFPVEIDSQTFENDYFPKNGPRYNRYIDALKKIGINKKNCFIGNPYRDSNKKLGKLIDRCDVLLLPGGNPEMFFEKVLHKAEILYNIKKFKGIVIGESAGAELQLKRYFITSTNNFYKYFSFYDGFGLLNDPFYFDVHTVDTKDYKKELQMAANITNKTVYAVYNDGAMIYNRKTGKLEKFGRVEEIFPNL